MTSPEPPEKDATLTYAAGDVIAWVGPPNVGAPIAFEDVDSIAASTYVCLGWIDTSGYIFKLDETVKDIQAAGILTPIRTILTGGTKTIQAICMEAMNPYVRSLYDDVPVFPVTSSPLMPPTSPVAPMGPNMASYVIPDPPADNRYSLVLDSVDGVKAMRLYAPYAKVTARGNDQVQQADTENIDLTFTMYPGTINDGTNPEVSNAVGKRYINWGQSMADYFTTPAGLIGAGTRRAGSHPRERERDES